MLKAFIVTDDYTMILVNDQGEETVLGRFLPGVSEVLTEEFGSVVAEVSKDAEDSSEFIEATLSDEEQEFSVPDLELLGDDGDPGDRILPEELVCSSDPVEYEGLTPLDAEEVAISTPPRPIDPGVYAVYFVHAPRSAENPWGSRDSFAGTDSAVADMQGATLHSLPFYFQVIAALPRRLRDEFKTFRGRDGQVHVVQMKDRPYVIARAGDIDDAGNFIPGIVDEETGQRRERYFLLCAWSLYNIRTGERFPYQEPQAALQLNREFKQRVLARAKERYPHLFTSVLHPRKHLGVKYWKVDMPEGDGMARVAFRFWNGEYRAETVQIRNGEVVLPAAPVSSLLLFALQAVAWKLTERELLSKEVSE